MLVWRGNSVIRNTALSRFRCPRSNEPSWHVDAPSDHEYCSVFAIYRSVGTPLNLHRKRSRGFRVAITKCGNGASYRLADTDALVCPTMAIETAFGGLAFLFARQGVKSC
jgi:hypothetical protein